MSISPDANTIFVDSVNKPKIDTGLYFLQPEEHKFFQQLTGIDDEDELKSHILSVQAKAYEIFAYPCIRSFGFTRLKIAHIPGYDDALKLLQQRANPILLDIGCCFGNDARRAVVDGWTVGNVIASDLRQEFWDYGHELFKSTPKSFPAAFVAGDVFDPAMVAPRGAFITPEDITFIESKPTPTPLNSLQSLTPLQGKISAIHASAFFHLFSEEMQATCGHRLASLLSPKPGSVIFGQHAAQSVKGTVSIYVADTKGDARMTQSENSVMFCHSPESWKEMWIKDVFAGVDGKGAERIKVDVELTEVERKDLVDSYNLNFTTRVGMLNWCVTRL